MNASLLPPIRAAQAAATDLGHPPDRCDILQDGNTLVLRLSQTLVARVLTQPDGARPGGAWFAREIAVAQHLSHARAPSIPLHPQVPAGPHQHSGYTLNFWQFVTQIDTAPEPMAIGKTLHQCHTALRSFSQELPPMAILTESLELLQSSIHFDTETADLLNERLSSSLAELRAFPAQPLHGDAHLGNLLNTTQGLLWTDWEDSFTGPVEWDVASAIWNAHILENDAPTVQGILAGYGPVHAHALQQSLVARAAVMCIWYPILYPNPTPERQAKLRFRLDWLETNC